MTCSVISDNVTVLMNNSFPVDPKARVTPGSALQNPELSRIRLAALLRRRAPDERPKRTMDAFWTSFMSNISKQQANSNG